METWIRIGQTESGYMQSLIELILSRPEEMLERSGTLVDEGRSDHNRIIKFVIFQSLFFSNLAYNRLSDARIR